MAIITEKIEIWKQVQDFKTPLIDSRGVEHSREVATTKVGDHFVIIGDRILAQHEIDGETVFAQAIYSLEFFRMNPKLFKRLC